MQPIIPRAAILTWRCQHGTMRRGYVKPTASCVKSGMLACTWTEKKGSDDQGT